MPGSARITLAVGFVLVLAAWVAGSFGLPPEHRAAADIVAEVLAVPLLLLAWRYRRHRLAAAAVVVAGANLVARLGLIDDPGDLRLPLLCLFVSLAVALLALDRDRPVWSTCFAAWLALVALALWFTAAGPLPAGDWAASVLSDPRTPVACFAVAAAVVVGSFAIRRGAFGASLIWVLVACAAALLPPPGARPESLFLTAAQLTLLAGLFEEAYRLAYHDQLTGLPGRRALDEAMRGLGGAFTIAMVDIDHFKRFNDRHGHDAGDQVLRMVADELGRVGGGGRSHRYGGEEFAILFAGKRVAEVRDELETVRRAIEARRFALRAADRPKTRPDRPKRRSTPTQKVTVTVSIGAADSNARRSSPEAVLRAADRALYRAKKAGRNRLVAAGDRLSKNT